MKIYLEKDYEAVSRRAAEIIAAEILKKPDCVLGLATGSTPVGTYQALIEMVKEGKLSFKDVRTINLDEYKGLPGDHEQSYRWFMDHNLFDHIDIDKANTHVPDGLAPDSEEACRQYDKLIASLGGASIQLLGIGHNGHIAFNEPSDKFIQETHVVDLAESTIEANARFFASADEVPRQALTMGIGGIMRAQCVLLLATGEGKADALYNAVCGPFSPKCPASSIKLHRNAIIVGDEPALSKLIAAGVEVVC